MSAHRVKCRNLNCKYEGMMEAKSGQVIMKKAFLDRKNAFMKSRGIAPEPEIKVIRCPKCGSRWRVRADQLR